MPLKLLIAALTIFTTPSIAYAGDEVGGTLNIRVGIIQCGKIENIRKTCERNSKCCIFVREEDDEDAFEIAEAVTNVNLCSPAKGQSGGSYNPLCANTAK